MKNNKILFSVLAILFAIFISLPFLIRGTSIISLFAFIPLLFMEDIASQSKQRHFWLWHYSAFVLWNSLSTYWVCNATIAGGIFAILANSAQMSIIFGIFRYSKKHLSKIVSYIFLASLWIAWEKVYHNAEISWPWLSLGNVFAKDIELIQWYEFTGSLGGSLWVWACNLSIFAIIKLCLTKRWTSYNSKAKYSIIISTISLFILPIACSLYMYKTYEEKGDSFKSILLQTNIDPYNKFKALSQSEQDRILCDNIDSLLNLHYKDSSILLIAPETFTNGINLSSISNNQSYQKYQGILRKYPKAQLMFGASTYELIKSKSKPSYTARPYSEDYWYEVHNSAITTGAYRENEIYHKSKLVVGVEYMPYPAFFNKIDEFIGPAFGRCVGQKERSILHFYQYNDSLDITKSIEIAPIICYESIYGDYCREYIQKGAKALTIITNDSWWGDTAGYKQHLNYASLRAIESRRDIARCANTGISAHINQRGDIVSCTKWWQKDSLIADIKINDKITFFVKNGDFAGKLCSIIALLLFFKLIKNIKLKEKDEQ